jgi:hypothetical protein
MSLPALPRTAQSKEKAMSAKLVSVGNGFLLLTSEEFASGFLAGHLAYMVERRGMPVSDDELATVFLTRLSDPHESQLSGIGFLVGWLATLANKGLKERLPVPLAERTPGERK